MAARRRARHVLDVATHIAVMVSIITTITRTVIITLSSHMAPLVASDALRPPPAVDSRATCLAKGAR